MSDTPEREREFSTPAHRYEWLKLAYTEAMLARCATDVDAPNYRALAQAEVAAEEALDALVFAALAPPEPPHGKGLTIAEWNASGLFPFQVSEAADEIHARYTTYIATREGARPVRRQPRVDEIAAIIARAVAPPRSVSDAADEIAHRWGAARPQGKFVVEYLLEVIGAVEADIQKATAAPEPSEKVGEFCCGRCGAQRDTTGRPCWRCGHVPVSVEHRPLRPTSPREE